MRPQTRRCARTLMLLAVLTSPGALLAQTPRAGLVRDGVAAYEGFEPDRVDRARQLFRAALNPALGAPDSVWGVAAQYLAQVLIEEAQNDLADLWLRWAARLHPDMTVDTETFLPAVVRSFTAARSAVASAVRDTTAAQIEWEWAAVAGQVGQLRVEASSTPVTAGLQLDGSVITLGANMPLTPGSYQLIASAAGFDSLVVTQEVLPGITTVIRYTLASKSELPAATAATVRSRVGIVFPRRFGGQETCAAGFLAGRDGLFLSTYAAVRGADSVEVVLGGGTRLSSGVEIAAYDVASNVVVLKLPITGTDSVNLGSTPIDGQFAWSLGSPDCAGMSTSRVQIASVLNPPNGPLSLAAPLADSTSAGPLIDRSGAVLGFGAKGRTAIPIAQALASLAQARDNIVGNQLMGVVEVAERENHRFGAVDIRSQLPQSFVRITPLETWHWSDLTQTVPLPTRFSGPMGRYALELVDGQEIRVRDEIELSPGALQQILLAPQPIAAEPQVTGGGGGFPIAVPILGAIGAVGVLAALALGGGGDDSGTPPGPSTGGINIVIPFNN